MIDVFNINDLIYKMNVNMNVDSENSNQQTMKYKDVVDKIRHIISKYGGFRNTYKISSR